MLLIPKHGFAAVDLLYFTSTAETDSILLEWETAQEINSAGFYIQRRSNPADEFQRIGEFIPSAGDPFTGQYYFIYDDTAIVGVLYYYRLEMVDASGNSDFSDTDEAQIIGPTPTSTMTISRTATTTGTELSSTPTPQTTIAQTSTTTVTSTVTRTPKNTRTNTPAPSVTRSPTSRPSVANTFTATSTELTPTFVPELSSTPTSTLEPLPTFNQTFPLSTSTATILASIPSPLEPSPTPVFDQSEPLSSQLKLLILIIILLWISLAGFIVFYLRRVNR